mmetsp:Transcript_62173/g.124631  ORF Transcript_62173/g.124631 Transcript_62173/m.124631 type:complete len:412 (-) Transcript_62173:219-1454(-)
MQNLYSLQTPLKPLAATKTAQMLMTSQNTNGASSRKEAAQASSSLFALADAAEVISCYGAADFGGGGGPGEGVRDLSVEKSRGDGTLSREVTHSTEDLTEPEFTDDVFATSEGSWLKKRLRVDDRDCDDADKKKPKVKVEKEPLEAFEVVHENCKKPLDVSPITQKPQAPSCHAVNLAGPGPITSSQQQLLHAHHPHQGPQKQVRVVPFPSQQPIHDPAAGSSFRGGYPKGVNASDGVHEALQPQPQMPQPHLYQQQPRYNYHQHHQVGPWQAQHYNPQSLYQQQLLLQQQLPYPFQYPLMQPPGGSTTTSGLLQQAPGHPSTCSFAPPQPTSAMAVMQTAPPPALTTAESDHFQQLHLQRVFLWEQQQLQQQQQLVQQQQQQQRVRGQMVPLYQSRTNIYIRTADHEAAP